MNTLNTPLPNPDRDAAERAEGTHNFIFDGDASRCADCDCRWGSVSSEWDCGTKVPRQIITFA